MSNCEANLTTKMSIFNVSSSGSLIYMYYSQYMLEKHPKRSTYEFFFHEFYSSMPLAAAVESKAEGGSSSVYLWRTSEMRRERNFVSRCSVHVYVIRATMESYQ
jgi:hypothetical protein